MLETHVKDFLQTTSYKNLDTVDGSKGLCDGIAKELQKFFSSLAIDSEIIEGIGYTPQLSETAHQDWKQFAGKDQKFLAHVVLKVDSLVIDLTAAQFGIEKASRTIYPLDIFKKEWKKVKKLNLK